MFDGLMLLSLASSKEGDDCIYQALVYLRDALSTVVLHSHSEQSSAGKRVKGLCVFDHIPPFIICVLYTVDRCPAL